MPEYAVFQKPISVGISDIDIHLTNGGLIHSEINFEPPRGYLRLTITYIEDEYDPGPGGVGID